MSIRATIIAGLVAISVMLALTCAGLWFWKQRDNARDGLDAAKLVIQTKQAQIDDLKEINKRQAEYKQANDVVIAQFFAKVDGINGSLNRFSGTLSDLRHTNVDVEKYLSQPIPVPLAALLNGLCDTPATCNNYHP